MKYHTYELSVLVVVSTPVGGGSFHFEKHVYFAVLSLAPQWQVAGCPDGPFSAAGSGPHHQFLPGQNGVPRIPQWAAGEAEGGRKGQVAAPLSS